MPHKCCLCFVAAHARAQGAETPQVYPLTWFNMPHGVDFSSLAACAYMSTPLRGVATCSMYFAQPFSRLLHRRQQTASVSRIAELVVCLLVVETLQ